MSFFAVFSALVLLTSVADAFGIPHAFVDLSTSHSLSSFPSSFLLSEGGGEAIELTATDAIPSAAAEQATAAAQAAVQAATESGILDQAGGVLYNIAVAVTAVLFLIAGAVFLYGSFIIPAAAKELEREAKELDPVLWEEYQAKLAPGEEISQRPELMQELGMKLQPLLDKKIMELEMKGQTPPSSPSPFESSSSPPPFESSLQTTTQWDDDDGSTVVETKPSEDDSGSTVVDVESKPSESGSPGGDDSIAGTND